MNQIKINPWIAWNTERINLLIFFTFSLVCISLCLYFGWEPAYKLLVFIFGYVTDDSLDELTLYKLHQFGAPALVGLCSFSICVNVYCIMESARACKCTRKKIIKPETEDTRGIKRCCNPFCGKEHEFSTFSQTIRRRTK